MLKRVAATSVVIWLIAFVAHAEDAVKMRIVAVTDMRPLACRIDLGLKRARNREPAEGTVGINVISAGGRALPAQAITFRPNQYNVEQIQAIVVQIPCVDVRAVHPSWSGFAKIEVTSTVNEQLDENAPYLFTNSSVELLVRDPRTTSSVKR